MNITATENALEFMDMHPEFNLPLTAQECFAGMTTLDGVNTPDLTVGIAYMNELLTQIKNQLKGRIKDISPKNSSFMPSKTSLDYIVNNIDITLITEEDTKSGTSIPVRNLFKYKITKNNEHSYEVICRPPEPQDNLFGVYLSSTGSIILWIDRIVRLNKSNLIFQKVLLHEMIHAFLDIYPRVYFKYPNGMCSIITAIGKINTKESEETIDNFLVLDCYSHCSKEHYDFIKDFISNQPVEYRAAIHQYSKQKDYSLIKAHLEDKVSVSEYFDISQSIKYFSVGDDEPDEEEEKEYLIGLFIWTIPAILHELVGSFKEFDKNSSEILCKRVLLDIKDYADFRSPWITFRLNLSTKIISIRIGNILYYQFNVKTGDDECFDLLNHKKINSGEYLDIEISTHTWCLICDFIFSLNPHYASVDYYMHPDIR